jgi:nucleoside 2-deoxyribosyltransferase
MSEPDFNKVYIAAPWPERQQAKDLAERLEKKGYKITHKWWEYEGEAPNGMDPNADFMESCALDDWRAVEDADFFVLLNLQDRGKETSGKAVETGIALANMKEIHMVGPKTNVFHYLESYVYLYKSIEELESYL